MTASPELMVANKRAAMDLGIWRGPSEGLASAEGPTLCPGGSGHTLYPDGVNGPHGSYGLSIDELDESVYLLIHAAGITVERPCAHCHAPWMGGECRGPFHGETKRETVEAARVLLDVDGCPDCEGAGGWELLGRDEGGHGGACGRCRPDREGIAGLAHTIDPTDATVMGDWLLDDPGRSALDRTTTPRDPIGAILSLWLAGEMREEHVLGVEELDGEWLFSLGREAHDELLADGWAWSGKSALFDDMTRPTLEARP